MTEITYQITAEDIASKSLRVTVPVEILTETERQTTREYARSASLPGFRKGSAPEAVIRRRFATEIRQHVVEESMRRGYQKVLEETGIRPIADPQVRNVSIEDGQPLGFDVIIEIRPELTLATTGGFALSRTLAAVTPDVVQAQLDQLRESRAAWEPIEGERPSPGQLVSVTVADLVDGAVTEERAPHELVLGEGQALPALEEQIMTLVPGETKDTELHYPEDSPDEARRGTSRSVRITLHGAKRKILPPLDDAFAREIGDGAFADLAALEEAVQADLTAEATRTAEQGVRDELIERIAEANTVPAPDGLTHRLMHAYAEAYRIPPEQFAAFESSFRPIAERQVRRELILDAVATAQNLRATEADIDARVAEMAAARGVETGKLYASLQQSNRLADLERSLTEDRTFAWLLSQSTVTEVTA